MSKITFTHEVESALKTLDQDPAYVGTKLKYEVGDEVLRVLDEKQMSRAELAKRLGKSRQYVTKMLKAETNFTLDSIASLAVALQKEFRFTFTEPGAAAYLWRALDGGGEKCTALTVKMPPSQGIGDDAFAAADHEPGAATGVAVPAVIPSQAA